MSARRTGTFSSQQTHRDDAPVVLLQHFRQAVLTDEKGGIEVEIQVVFPSLIVVLVGCSHGETADEVNENVHPVQIVDELANCAFVEEIQVDKLNFGEVVAGHLAFEAIDFGGVAIGDGEVRPSGEDFGGDA